MRKRLILLTSLVMVAAGCKVNPAPPSVEGTSDRYTSLRIPETHREASASPPPRALRLRTFQRTTNGRRTSRSGYSPE